MEAGIEVNERMGANLGSKQRTGEKRTNECAVSAMRIYCFGNTKVSMPDSLNRTLGFCYKNRQSGLGASRLKL